ncbi:MAG TPA: hypothetical protein VF347_01905, partial [Candidatus Humimicrobiaceae bacterium]
MADKMTDSDIRQSNPPNQVIVLSDNKSGLPFSKGILASSISVTGLEIGLCHKIAYEIEQYLVTNKIFKIAMDDLRSTV